MAIVINVIDGNKRSQPLQEISRSPRQHRGWESVTFQGKRYQVFGGIRGPEFIDLANPLRSRTPGR
jgi:hypothetical protein